MINTFTQLKNDVIVKLGISTTTAYWTDDILDDFIDEAHTWAAGYKKWAFTEKRDQTTSWDGNEEQNYPSDFKTDSIRILTIGGKRLKKVLFKDYLAFREDYASATDRIFSDYNRVYYVNPNCGLSGTIAAYGQYLPALDPTDESSTTIFSGAEEEGNEAISEKALEYCRIREQKYNEANVHAQKAAAILDGIWEKVSDEKSGYHPKESGMWKRIDVVEGDYHNELFKRDQF